MKKTKVIDLEEKQIASWINRLTETITYGSLEVVLTVRGESAMDHFREVSLTRRLYKLVTGEELNATVDLTGVIPRVVNELAEMINRTESIKGLPGKWATADSDDKTLKASYDLLEQIPGSIVTQWRELLQEANKPPPSPDNKNSKAS